MKIETHLHTKFRSPCANVKASEIPALYKKQGYDAIIVTDHYMEWLFDEYYPKGSTESKIDFFLSGYREVKESAEKLEMKTFLGVEMTLSLNYEAYPIIEYLLYGMSEDFFFENLELYKLKDKELFQLCEKNDIAMLQSHPFRGYAKRAKIENLHGMEVANMNPRHNSYNDIAIEYAKVNNLIQIAGSDFHECEDVSGAGIILSDNITTNSQLARALKSRNFQRC